MITVDLCVVLSAIAVITVVVYEFTDSESMHGWIDHGTIIPSESDAMRKALVS